MQQIYQFADKIGFKDSECTFEEKESVIGDAVKNLLYLKLLIAVNQDQIYSWVYDSDKMRESSFKATAKGVEWMEFMLKEHKK